METRLHQGGTKIRIMLVIHCSSPIIRDCDLLRIGKFRTHCTISAELSELCSGSSNQALNSSRKYWKVEFEVDIKFGTTELEARLKWFSEVSCVYMNSSLRC